MTNSQRGTEGRFTGSEALFELAKKGCPVKSKLEGGQRFVTPFRWLPSS